MGQEIGQSKELLDNTYNVPKINNMNWELVKERESMVNFMSDLIKVRRSINLHELNNLQFLRDNIDVNHLSKIHKRLSIVINYLKNLI